MIDDWEWLSIRDGNQQEESTLILLGVFAAATFRRGADTIGCEHRLLTCLFEGSWQDVVDGQLTTSIGSSTFCVEKMPLVSQGPFSMSSVVERKHTTTLAPSGLGFE